MDQKCYLRLITVVLGFWLLTIPSTFGYQSQWMACSDHIAGLLLILFGFISLSSKHVWAVWAISIVGVWLEFAPLLFWAPEPVSYLNDTVIGVLAIIFSVLIPRMPGIEKNPEWEIPSGWSYNPSAWSQRIPIIGLALICWFISRFLATYQLGYIQTMWDPVFGSGTVNVITSQISKDFPVSDAGLGALAYTLEALMCCKGDSRRWCTMPWIVISFGILVVPLGLVSIALIILQPLVVGAWCFLCLLTAASMLIMVTLTVDEVTAALQFLKQQKLKQKNLWKVFWKGDAPGQKSNVQKTKPRMFQGVTSTWNLSLCALLGLWLMLSPSFYNTQFGVANCDHVTGAFVIVCSVVSMAEVIRSGRFLNCFFALSLFISPWVLTGGNAFSAWNDHLVGIALILLSLPQGRIREHFRYRF